MGWIVLGGVLSLMCICCLFGKWWLLFLMFRLLCSEGY